MIDADYLRSEPEPRPEADQTVLPACAHGHVVGHDDLNRLRAFVGEPAPSLAAAGAELSLVA